MGEAGLRRKSLSGRCRPFHSGRRKELFRAGTDMGAAHGGNQRHLGRLSGAGSKTVLPAEATAKLTFRLVEGQNPKKIRKAFRDFVKASSCRRTARPASDGNGGGAAASPWPMTHHGLRQGTPSTCRGMGNGARGDGRGRLHPRGRKFQAASQAGQRAGGLRPRRRQRPQPGREIRGRKLSQGHPHLGPHHWRNHQGET